MEGPGQGNGQHVVSDTSCSSKSCLSLNQNVESKLRILYEWRLDSSRLRFSEEGVGLKGGFATVFKATLIPKPSPGASKTYTEESRHKSVAVKKLNIEDTEDPNQVLYRGLREVEFLVALNHVNIVPVKGFVEDISEGQIWLVFPWANNADLHAFVASCDWKVPERISLIRDVVEGVEYLHTQDPPISHGDLKSTNILVNGEYRAVITDFGSARRVRPKPAYGSSSKRELQAVLEKLYPTLESVVFAATNTMTLTGSMYTLRWAAPELLENEEDSDTKSDMWAMGWVFYEIMTGTIPFESIENDTVVILKIVNGELPPLTEHARLSLIVALGSIMAKCWRIDPEQRPTATICLKELRWLPSISPDPHRSKDNSSKADLLIEIGNMYAAQNDYENALASADEAVKMLSGLMNSTYGMFMSIQTRKDLAKRQADALWLMANLHRRQGNTTEAIALYSDILRIFERNGDEQGRGTTLLGMASIRKVQKETIEAARLYSEAAQVFAKIGYKVGRAQALKGLASIHHLQRQDKNALELYSEASQIFEEIGNKVGQAEALAGMGDVHRGRKQYLEAEKLYSESALIFGEIGRQKKRASVVFDMAKIAQSRKESRKSISLYSEVASICDEIGDQSERAYAMRRMGDIHLFLEEYVQASSLFSEAARIYGEVGEETGRGSALLRLAGVHERRKEYPEAARCCSDAAQVFEAVGNQELCAHALQTEGLMHHKHGDLETAIALYDRATILFEKAGVLDRSSIAKDKANVLRHQLMKSVNSVGV